MMDENPLNKHLLDQLTRPGSRLPELEHWLLAEVWSETAFRKAGQSPKEYLVRGEEHVNKREAILTAAADSIATELAATANSDKTVARFFEENPKAAAVVFDGCSLREIPRLLQLAKESRRPVLESGCGRAAVPSETDYFVSDRLGFGLPTLGPSQISGRGELRKRNVRFYYFRQPGEHHTIQDGGESLLLWSRFPDQRYTDSTAVNESMFEGLWDGFEQAWKRTVQAVPADRKVLVTSDHGYVFLGPGLSDRSLDGVDRCLDGRRFRVFESRETLPRETHGLWIDPEKRLVVLAGRGHNRPHAPSASQSVYRHGGLTLMEVLTPWIVLGPVE